MDINTKLLKKNAFRVTKKRGMTASRVRVPGGHLEAIYLPLLQNIAETYGNGTVHITSRQGFEIPGIAFENMPQVNELLQPIIEGLDINQQVPGKGYSAAGTRNVVACIGNRVCPYACYDTTGFAQRIEKAIFPNDLHFKIALTGCPNDCAKVRMHDFGIMGMTEPQYNIDRCVNCGACVKVCKKNPLALCRRSTIKSSVMQINVLDAANVFLLVPQEPGPEVSRSCTVLHSSAELGKRILVWVRISLNGWMKTASSKLY